MGLDLNLQFSEEEKEMILEALETGAQADHEAHDLDPAVFNAARDQQWKDIIIKIKGVFESENDNH